jgi:hypothetical protein
LRFLLGRRDMCKSVKMQYQRLHQSRSPFCCTSCFQSISSFHQEWCIYRVRRKSDYTRKLARSLDNIDQRGLCIISFDAACNFTSYKSIKNVFSELKRQKCWSLHRRQKTVMLFVLQIQSCTHVTQNDELFGLLRRDYLTEHKKLRKRQIQPWKEASRINLHLSYHSKQVGSPTVPSAVIRGSK